MWPRSLQPKIPRNILVSNSTSSRPTAKRNLNETHRTAQLNSIVYSGTVAHEEVNGDVSQFQIPFAHAKMGLFAQERPRLKNQFTEDSFIQRFIQRHVPNEHFGELNKRLMRFGQRVTEDIYQLSLRMELEPPRLEQTDAWGHRMDRLMTSTAWQSMKCISAEEGLIASGYEREFGEFSRLYQMCLFYLFEPSGGLYGCPLAMTNGAARTIELLKDSNPWLYNTAFPHLTSRNPETFWTSGQWMTEKRGGSDVAGGTETVAVEQADGSFKLYGYKWFSSATDADMTLTLARVIDRDGNIIKGTKGLSLFYVEVKDQSSAIQLVKLKNKLGTRQLPTAELLIDGAKAFKISDEGRGVASMSDMLTLTRIHTAVHAAAAMRRVTNLARDYATRRHAFGGLLVDHPLHMHTLAKMEVEVRAAAIFALEVSRLLGRQESLTNVESLGVERDVLRLVVPLLKLYVSKRSVSVVSEGLECFGGQGYIEDTDLPRLLRDTQVTPIWEGTTNILSLDVIRAIRNSAQKDHTHVSRDSRVQIPAVLQNFKSYVTDCLIAAKNKPELEAPVTRLESALDQVLKVWLGLDPRQQEMAARQLAFSLARIFMGALLVEHAADPIATSSDVYAAQRWCETDLTLLCRRTEAGAFTSIAKDFNMELVFEGYSSH